MAKVSPQFIIIAGPNGAGKSTTAPVLLPSGAPYINADDIAQSMDDIGVSRDIGAGRQVLTMWSDLADNNRDFAVETTLASRSFVRRISDMKDKGYQFHLLYLWLPDVDLAIKRVAARVNAGGHDIPEPTIRRRYASGRRNFLDLYRSLADTWAVFVNIEPGAPVMAAAWANRIFSIQTPDIWKEFQCLDQ